MLSAAEGCEVCGRDWVPLSYHDLVPRFAHGKAAKRGWHRAENLGNERGVAIRSVPPLRARIQGPRGPGEEGLYRRAGDGRGAGETLGGVGGEVEVEGAVMMVNREEEGCSSLVLGCIYT
ncbi:uncharacterized protein F4812DRAFT_446593 [Daldinia caldariorum]|uniref:uncharacterized protein n=1 Tax=Daldinia caldariorum TaxID=326644 RepID=UPI002008459C|nr:uncharacterized protein F4812DRAFT_446593 [Daldinia caldariorum]KAI1463581.1 hypothetical protein F4812DRAFT_446593 [Daldinia caldariorum]